MTISLECVLRTKEHANLLLSWRSDPEARAMSIHSHVWTEEDFWHYFRRVYFLLKDLPTVFAVVDGKRAAFVGFDPVGDVQAKAALISLVVAPELRGKGIGSAVLKEIIPYALQQGYEELYAEIKPENEASKHVFEKAGFTFVKDVVKEKVKLGLYRLKLSQSKQQKGVFVIAEAGSNWRMGNRVRDLKMSYSLIQAAKEAGCNAIKFQVYRADTVYVPNAGSSDYLDKMGIKESVKEIFEDLSMPYDMIPEIATMCSDAGIEFMATPFSKKDFEAVDPYVTHHKIGSYEIGHIRLLELAAKSKKPLFLSTGVSNIEDIEWAINYYQAQGGIDLTLLHCCAQYPAEDSGMNLRMIPWMNSYFQLPVGLSDHSPNPYIAPVAAVALGATAIEKHFTLDKRLPGPDHSFAVEPAELKAMVDAIRTIEVMRGQEVKQVVKEEMELFSFARRGLQAITPIKKGDIFKEDYNVAILRPGKQKIGIHPRYIDSIVGKAATRDIKLGEGIQNEDWK